MPNERTVMLLIKAQNATGEALKAVQGDLGKVEEAATKMGEQTEKGFMQGIRGAFAFVRQIKGIYFIIAGVIAGIVLKLAQPINEYERAMLKIQNTANLAAKDIAQLGKVFEEQGKGIGLGTLALATGTRSVTEATSDYVGIQGVLVSLYNKLLPKMSSQEDIMSRLGIGINELYAAMGNQEPLKIWDVLHGKITTLQDAYGLFGDKAWAVMEILGKTREELVKADEAMANAAKQTEKAKEKMRDYEQAVKDLKTAWLDLLAIIGPPLLTELTAALEFIPTIAENMKKMLEDLRKGVPAGAKALLTEEAMAGAMQVQGGVAAALAAPPAQYSTAAAPSVPGVLPPSAAEEVGVSSMKNVSSVIDVYNEKNSRYWTDVVTVMDDISISVEVTSNSLVGLWNEVQKIKARMSSADAKLNAIQGNIE